MVTEQEKGRAPYGGAEHGGRCGLPPATGAVKWITRAEWGGGLQVHGELVTWAQNREDNWTSQSDSTNGATEHRQRQRRGGEGGDGGERAMHAALKGEDISCCCVVQSQKAAVRWTEERHKAGAIRAQTNRRTNSQDPNPSQCAWEVSMQAGQG